MMNESKPWCLRRWWVLNYLFALLLSFSFVQAGAPGTAPAWIYAVAVWLTYALVYLLPAIIISRLLWPLAAGRWRIAYQSFSILLFGISHLLIFADARLYDLFGFHINSFVLNLLTTPGGIDSLGTSNEAQLTFAAISLGILLVPALLWLLARRLHAWRPFSGKAQTTTLLVLLLVLAVGERLAYGISSAMLYSPALSVANAFPLYNRVTFRTLANSLGFSNPRPNTLHAKRSGGKLNYPLHPLDVQTPEHPMNLLWLVAESLRWDMLSPEIMPNTWKFSQQSIRLEQHLSGGNGTRQGLFSLMYGLYGAYWDSFLLESRGPVLLDVLKKQNYQFYMTTSASFTYPEFDRTLFSAIKAENLHQADKSLPPWKRDIANAKAVNDFISQRDPSRPFMSFFFFESTHARYDFPDSAVIRSPYLGDVNYALMSKKSLSKDIAQLKNRYINASHHVDAQIGRILDHLKQQGLLDHTIVIITGDHGEEFMEKGHWGHNAGFHEEQIHTPMVLHIPGRKPQVIHYLTSHMDIVPTLLPLLGVKNPLSDYTQGHNLFSSQRPGFVVASDWSGVAYIDAQYKFYVPYRSMSGRQNVLTTRDDHPISDSTDFYRNHMAVVRQILKGFKAYTRK